MEKEIMFAAKLAQQDLKEGAQAGPVINRIDLAMGEMLKNVDTGNMRFINVLGIVVSLVTHNLNNAMPDEIRTFTNTEDLDVEEVIRSFIQFYAQAAFELDAEVAKQNGH